MCFYHLDVKAYVKLNVYLLVYVFLFEELINAPLKLKLYLLPLVVGMPLSHTENQSIKRWSH